jgi:hypothetical protein
MSVTNRKMFRPRNARNRLNQLGGIMASSPELMQTVQRFDEGGGVNANIPFGAQTAANLMARGMLSQPITSIRDFVGYDPQQTGISSLQREAAARGKAFDAGQAMPLSPLARPAVTGIQGGEAFMRSPGAQQTIQNLQSMAPDTLFAEAMGALRMDPRSMPSDLPEDVFVYGASAPSGDQIVGMDTSELPEDVFVYGASAPSGDQIVGMDTRESPSFADISKRVAAGEIPADVFVPSGSRLAAGTDEAPKPRSSLLMVQGTPKDIAKTQELANNLFDKTFGNLVNKETSKDKPTKSDAYAALPSTSNKENIQKDPEAALSFGAKIDAVAKEFLGSNADENDKNDLILELTGRKDPQKSMSTKDRYKENLELYREVFGENPEEDRKIDGYNLAMMGFLIASGDSPNALQNIARGAAAGVERIQKTAEARKARDEKLKLAALQRAATQEDAETERQTTWAQTLYKDAREGKRAQDKMKFELATLNIKLEQEQELANDKAVSDQTRADANNEATLLRTMINNYGELGNLAATQLMTQGFDPKKIFTPEGFKTLTNTMEDLAKRFPELSRTSQKSEDPGKSLEAFVRDRQEEFDDNVDYQDLMSDRLGKPVSDITPEDIKMYAMRQFNVEQSASPTSQSASPTSQSASPTSQFVLGQIITQGSNRFRVTGINSDGTPITEPVQ